MDTAIRPAEGTSFPLPPADLESSGFRKSQIDRLIALIERHIAEGRYPGCQIALARHGKLALFKSFGRAATVPSPRAAADDTLWLLYSNTKVVTAVALWVLAERGLFSFSDKIADHVPEFAKNAKGNITVLQTITHQAGFPNAVVGKGRVGRPQAAAPGGVRLPARVHARLEGALSRPDRALDARRADRGGDRQGFPRRHPRDRDRAAGPQPRIIRRLARFRVHARGRHARTNRERRCLPAEAPNPTPPTGARPARRAARATARPARWRRSTR